MAAAAKMAWPAAAAVPPVAALLLVAVRAGIVVLAGLDVGPLELWNIRGCCHSGERRTELESRPQLKSSLELR